MIIDNLGKVISFIDKYTDVMSKNHLVEEIRQYDKEIKDYDKKYVDKDNQLIERLTHSTGQSEYLTQSDMENLFGQQIRKIMSKQVKQIDKDVKFNVKKGTMGDQTKLVDYIMYLAIAFVIGFGYMSFKKLREQSDMLVI